MLQLDAIPTKQNNKACVDGLKTFLDSDQHPHVSVADVDVVCFQIPRMLRSGPIAWQGMAHNKFAAPWTQHAVLMSQETGSALAGWDGIGISQSALLASHAFSTG